MVSITAIIPAKNEEKNIIDCLKSVQFCNEVIVISSGTDKTESIAKKMGATVIVRKPTDGANFILVQKDINSAAKNAKNDWILRVDADERVTSKGAEEMSQIINGHNHTAAYGVPRKQYFFGDFLRGGDWAYDRLVRLFKKNKAYYDEKSQVHEQFIVEGKTDYLKEPLLHYSHPTLETAIQKFNTYTSVEINDLKETKLEATWHMLSQPPYIFLRWMLWHNGYRDGLRGIVAGMFRSWYAFILYAKYLEKIRR